MSRLASGCAFCAVMALLAARAGVAAAGTAYYFDSVRGAEGNAGTAEAPWKSLSKLDGLKLEAGDTVHFKRGSAYTGTIAIDASGTAGDPITFRAYGLGELPRFTNRDYGNSFGRVFDVKGSHLVFEKLLFHDCAVEYDERRRAQHGQGL